MSDDMRNLTLEMSKIAKRLEDACGTTARQ